MKTQATILLLAIFVSVFDYGGQVALASGEHEDQSIDVFVIPAITNTPMLPDSIIPRSLLSNSISMTAAPGEYEPASFVVRAITDVSSLHVEATDLTGIKGSIPSSNVDIRVVKCWNQAGLGGSSTKDLNETEHTVLTPELLLKDDSLVRVEGSENYLKLTDGTYVSISDERDTCQGWQRIVPIEELPVRDKPTLQPVAIPAGTNKQFWVTVKTPDKAVPGIYYGSIRLRLPSGAISKIQLQLEVLPIALSEPRLTYSMYYWGRLDRDWPNGSISSNYKSEHQFRAEMKNLISHGVTNPIIKQRFDDADLLATVLEIRNEVGMGTQPLYYQGIEVGNPTAEPELALLRNKVRDVLEYVEPYGIPEVYFYGIDEAQSKELASQRPAWEAVHEAGGKIFASGFADSIAQPGNYALMGDTQDLFVCAGEPNEVEAAKWHSQDKKILCYANPQVGVEKPETYRRNYGLLLWQRDYDGAMNWTYQYSACNIWNDFDHDLRRDPVFAYPTVDGVIDTIQWEGWREGVDDVRYLTTLLDTIETASAEGQDTSSAQRYLADLKASDLERRDLSRVRAEIIGHILHLQAPSQPLDYEPPHISSIRHSLHAGPRNSTVITWHTNERTTGWVEYGKIPNLGLVAKTDVMLLTDHTVTIPKLDPNSTYYYRVTSKDSSGNLAASDLLTLATSPTLAISIASETDPISANANGRPSQSELNLHIAANTQTSCFLVWDNSLVLWAPFSEDHDVVDHSGNSIRGIDVGTTYAPSGRYGGARTFDGQSSYIDFGNDETLNLAADITVEAWVNFTENSQSWEDNQFLFRKPGTMLAYWDSATKKLSFNANITEEGWKTVVRSTKNSWKAGQWYHIAVCNDTIVNRSFVLVDGKIDSVGEGHTFVTSSSSLTLGDRGKETLNGRLDEVRIWNRALRPAEIKMSQGLQHSDGLSLPVDHLEPGSHDLRAYAVDAVGNVVRTERNPVIVKPGERIAVTVRADPSALVQTIPRSLAQVQYTSDVYHQTETPVGIGPTDHAATIQSKSTHGVHPPHFLSASTNDEFRWIKAGRLGSLSLGLSGLGSLARLPQF